MEDYISKDKIVTNSAKVFKRKNSFIPSWTDIAKHVYVATRSLATIYRKYPGFQTDCNLIEILTVREFKKCQGNFPINVKEYPSRLRRT